MGFNLLPWRERKKRNETISFIIYFLLALLVIFVFIITYQHHLKNSIFSKKLTQEKLSKKYHQLLALDNKKDLKSKEKILLQLEKNIKDVDEIITALQVIASSVSKNAYLTEIKFERNDINLKGASTNLNEVNQFISSLEKYHRFISIQLNNIIQKNETHFEIKVQYI